MTLRNRDTVVLRQDRSWDTILAVVGLVVAALLFLLRFYLSQILILTVPLVIGAASGIYLLAERYDHPHPAVAQWRLHARTGHVLRIAVLVGLAGMVFVGTLTNGRTLPFFGVATVVGMLILGQIVFLERDALSPTSVLLQVVGFAVVLRWVALLTTPSLIGVDAWEHLPEFATAIRDTGSLSAIDYSTYYGAPLYHLLVVFASQMFDSSLRVGLYATLGVVMPVSTLLVYFATRYVFPVRWALFAAAAFGITDHFVRWGLHLIPTSMGVVFFVASFYAVTRIYSEDRPWQSYGLLVGFVLAIIFTHQISTFVLLVFLAAGTVAQLLGTRVVGTASKASSASGSRVNFAAVLAFALPVTVLAWSRAPAEGPSFVEGMLAFAADQFSTIEFLNIASTATVTNDTIRDLTVTVPTSIAVLDVLGFLMVLLMTIIGVYALLGRRDMDQLTLTWTLTVGVMLFVTLGMPLLGLYFFIPGRWYAYLYLPMIVLGAYGFQHLELRMPSRQFVVLVVAFLLLFTAPMLMDRSATRDNPVDDESFSKFAYTQSEIDAARTISAIHPDGAEITTDHPYFLYLKDARAMNADSIQLTDEGTSSSDYVVYRTYQTAAGPIVTYEGTDVRVQLSRDAVCRSSMDVRYTNGDVQYCTAVASGVSR